MMELRPNFKYHLYWHTRYPKPEALASNTVFYRHLSVQQLKEQLTSPMHPRILATEQDFADLRRRVDADQTAADFYRQLYAQAEQLLQTAPPKHPSVTPCKTVCWCCALFIKSAANADSSTVHGRNWIVTVPSALGCTTRSWMPDTS